MHKQIRLKVNGEDVSVWVETHKTLLWLLREELHLKGTKEGCGRGECGACTVILNGEAVNSCLVLAMEADGAEVRTIEGEMREGRLSDLQEAFIRHNALQCGFCTPGMIMSARALLERHPHPTDEEIREAIEGNLCRCTGYLPVLQAIREVAARGARS
ncbi:MAG TPA: (2Fe-2S)-binding protein [Firmicutes bacterium]|nr:(2Fe-2S)-binding protein [Bacillota bacterium]